MRLNSTIRFHFAWTKVNKMKARGILLSKSPCLPGATSGGSWQARLARVSSQTEASLACQEPPLAPGKFGVCVNCYND